MISSLGDEGLSCTLCKLHPGRVKGSPHTGWTSSFSLVMDEGPTAHWPNLILRMDEGPTAHWVNLLSQEGWRVHCTLVNLLSLCKLHLERVKGSLHTGWTLSFRPSYGWGAHCTLPAKLHLQEGWGLAAYWLNPYLSIRRDEGPTAH